MLASFVLNNFSLTSIVKLKAINYLARMRKTSSSEIARALLEHPIGEISATYQILLNLHRISAGIAKHPSVELWCLKFQPLLLILLLKVSTY